MRKQSLRCMISTEALSKGAVPTVLVSTKCDNPSRSWEVDPGVVESLCSTFRGLEAFQTSASASETHKRCISVLLRNVMVERHGMSFRILFRGLSKYASFIGLSDKHFDVSSIAVR